MTNHWSDIKNADLVLIMGGNAAEAHPCGFKWVTEAMQHRKAKLIVVDPRFTRSAAVADVYAPIRVGTDIAFLGGVINYLLSKDKIHHDYVRFNTDVAFLTKPGVNRGLVVFEYDLTGGRGADAQFGLSSSSRESRLIRFDQKGRNALVALRWFGHGE